MQTELSPAERESIDRVKVALEAERKACTGGSLAVLWGDWDDALTDLCDGERAAVVR